MTRGAITTPERLAAALAEHARQIRTIVLEELARGGAGPLVELEQSLPGQATREAFADAYAQSVSYGCLAARWFARDRQDLRFTRANLCELLPSTSPWLRELVGRLVAVDGCPRLASALDAMIGSLSQLPITSIFCDIRDPAIHFYQHFLGIYDPQIRRDQGVYATPSELAAYVVRSVDAGLRERFGLRLGLADPTTWAELAERCGLAVPEDVTGERAFVTILDPATGTGTFLVAVIEVVHETMMAEYARVGLDAQAARRAWLDHVRVHLLPRLCGYELLLAPFIVCHLRIGLALQATGFSFGPDDRLNVSLRSALEPNPEAHTPTVFVGNPPYQRSAGPRGEWAERLVARFKRAVRDERNIQPLADDYIAFMGLGDELIGRAGCGVLALVVNGTCLSGRLHRGVRARLLERFDLLALCDLHGSQKVALREELCADRAAEADANVFDIQQGVAIVMAERLPSRERSTIVLHHDLIGSRAAKLAWLEARAAEPLRDHVTIQPIAPLVLFTSAERPPDEYRDFIALPELFEFCGVSGKPGKDELLVCFERDEVIPKLRARHTQLLATAKVEALTEAERKLAQRPRTQAFDPARVRAYAYRPGDTRWTYYEPEIWTRPVTALSDRLDGAPVLLTTKIVKDASFAHVWVTRELADVICLSATSSVNCYSFVAIKPERLGADIDALTAFDYVYAILHSPNYRRRYIEALRHDFPRIPIPARGDRASFVALARLGAELRELHLLERPCELASELACFVDGGDRTVTRVGEPRRALAAGGVLRINERSRFERVPQSAWELRIGGYRLLHKWLSDRKKAGRALSNADVAHYRRLVGVCLRTVELMDEIEARITGMGGWPAAFEPTHPEATSRRSAALRP